MDPIVLFNKLSSLPSEFVSLDGSDFSTVFLSGDCLIFGSMTLSLEECLEDESTLFSGHQFDHLTREPSIRQCRQDDTPPRGYEACQGGPGSLEIVRAHQRRA